MWANGPQGPSATSGSGRVRSGPVGSCRVVPGRVYRNRSAFMAACSDLALSRNRIRDPWARVFAPVAVTDACLVQSPYCGWHVF
ncbi:hypothetical protein CS0771_13100 [Catellatospora sp. IY07-71]|nr:hypothetical protein CS0771_13100 [Catellatospora sp. IY07-71]